MSSSAIAHHEQAAPPPESDSPAASAAPLSVSLPSLGLAERLGIDVVSAMTASLAVSPFIAIVDRSIIENASGARPLMVALKSLGTSFLRHPLQFLRRREFLIVYGLYTSTYAAANSISTVCEAMDTDNQMPKFIGTTAVNMTLCVAKDRAFTRMFGVIAPSSFPMASMGLFAMRDSMTVAASFNAPPLVAAQLRDATKHSAKPMDEATSTTIAQLVCPAAVQFLSTPLHLLGLDLYNNKGASLAQRLQFLKREYLKSAVARIGRIGPAFGIGGVGNTFCRDGLRAKLSSK